MRFSMKNVLAALSILVLFPQGFLYAGAEEPAAQQERTGSSHDESPLGALSRSVLNEDDANSRRGRAKENHPGPLDLSPLGSADFGIGGIFLEDSLKHSIELKGTPDSIARGPVMEEYSWKGLEIRRYNPFLLKYTGRTDLPSDFSSIRPGITEIRLAEGEGCTPRNTGIGTSREDMLRGYGRPNQVLWNEAEGNFYFNYWRDNQEIDFSVKDNRVSNIRIFFKNKNFTHPAYQTSSAKKGFLPDRDLYIAGFRPGDRFTTRDSGSWEKKIANPEEEIWYYAGYAVRLTAKGQDISALLLTDNRMVTSRGITLGDDVSTVEAVYGAPQRVEMDVSGSSPKTTYIYFSHGGKRILMFGFLNNKVDGVISTLNPKH